MAPIRVLVVEDSLTIRKRLVEVLAADPAIEVAGEAEDGKRAIELCRELRPDVITLDMMLPVMSGLACTEYIMAYMPTPILVVSASTNRGELFRTYDALAAGALDVLDKPRAEDDGDWDRQFRAAVKMVSRIRVVTHLRGRAVAPAAARVAPPPVPTRASHGGFRALAIGASTGGPAALVEILRRLPRRFPLPILLVLHLGQPFAKAFADWLDGQSPLPVSYARDGEPLAPVGEPCVRLAPPESHLVLARGKLRLTWDPPRHSCRPSVDVLFESMARELGDRAAACLLTGMGRDGAEGLLAMRRAGGLTIAQDEASSVVFGMPREAIALDAAERVLHLASIPDAIAALAPGAASGGDS